jgi:uncharacterized membrane protein
MRQSYASLLLVPALFALAWLMAATNALPATPGFGAAFALLIGGALVAGFVDSMRGLRARGRAEDQSIASVGIAAIFRLAIGLPVIACMLYFAMRAADLV